jgi:rhodanese-related sulfurtransferase
MKMLQRLSLLTGVAVILVLFIASTGICKKSGYNYISVKETKTRLDAGDHENGSMAIMTSQTEKEYKTGYIKAAYPTFARPLKTDADFAKLIPFLKKVKDTNEDIVFICPRGHSGAERPYDYFKKNGVDEKRLFIMEGGQTDFNKAYPKDVTYP